MRHFLLIFLVLSTILTASELDTVWYYATNDIVAEEIVHNGDAYLAFNADNAMTAAARIRLFEIYFIENRIDEDAYSALEECQIELDIQRTKWRRKSLKRFLIGLVGGAVVGLTVGVIVAH